MRPDRVTLLLALPLLVACAEAPRCVERGASSTLTIECSPGKVAVCGDDPEKLYDEQGALRPVPAASVADGLCPENVTNCRTRPVCQQDTREVVCNDGQAPLCKLGRVDELAPPRPSPQDAGSSGDDAGNGDPGTDEDAGTGDDAGNGDPADAGAQDDAGNGDPADAGAQDDAGAQGDAATTDPGDDDPGDD